MGSMQTGLVAFIVVFLHAGEARTPNNNVVVLTDCALSRSAYACAFEQAWESLEANFPDSEFDSLYLLPQDAAAWFRANASRYHFVINLGLNLPHMAFADAAAEHPGTWFADFVGCERTELGPVNLVCASFNEAQVAFTAGYLAGLVTSTNVTGYLGGFPVVAVKRFLNGFRMGVQESCPHCRVEGACVNSWAHVNNAQRVAAWLVREQRADVVFAAAGSMGSVAITRAAELGAFVIGVDRDEFVATFPDTPLRRRVITSAVKKVDVGLQVALRILMRREPGSDVPEIQAGNLVLDYGNGGVGLADCHQSCETISTAWARAKRKELAMAAGLVAVPTNSDGSYVRPVAPEPNTLVVAHNPALPPEPRTQHAMTTWATKWKEHVVVFGGLGEDGKPLGDLWLYELSFAKWLPSDHGLTVGEEPPALVKACAVGLESIVIFGGRNEAGRRSNATYLFSGQPPELGQWSSQDERILFNWSTLIPQGDPPAVEGPGCARLNSTCLLVVGGRSDYAVHADVDLLCVHAPGIAQWTRQWIGGAAGPPARERAATLVVPGPVVGLSLVEQVLVIAGGSRWQDSLRDVWALDLRSLNWTQLPRLPLELRSTPQLFLFSRAADNDGLGLQLAENSEDFGPGALTLDVSRNAWMVQAGAFLDPLGAGSDFSQAGAVYAGGSVWLFGGTSGESFLGGLYESRFTFRMGCPAGQEAKGVTCVPCAAGSASLGGSGAECLPCPPGKLAAQPGQSQCRLCGAGTFAASRNSTTCQDCPAGRSTHNLGGMSSCSNCSQGTFSDRASAQNCTACPAGTSTEAGEGAQYCTLCPVGTSTLGHPGRGRCSDCSEGRFSSLLGEGRCEACSAGRFAIEPGLSVCEFCNDTFTAERGATGPEECQCPLGRYVEQSTGRCALCSDVTPAGLRCPGGHKATDPSQDLTPFLLPGYMSLPHAPLEVYTCVQPTERCPGERSLRDASRICAGNSMQGAPQCGACADGFYTDIDGRCTPCDTDQSSAGVALRLVGSQALELLFIVYLYVRYNRPAQPGLITLGLLTDYLQKVQQVAQLPLEWPPLLTWVLEHLGLISIEGILILGDLRLECFMGAGTHYGLLLNALLPSTPLLHFAILGAVARMAGRPLQKDLVLNTLALIGNGIFITVCSSTLKFFITEEMPNGRMMVKQLPEVEFGSVQWLRLCPIGLISFCIYCVPFIAYLLLAVWMAPRWAASWEPFTPRYRFAFGPLRSDRFYWVAVSLFCKLLLVLVQLVSNSVHVRIYLMTFVLIVFWTLAFHAQPYKFKENNDVQFSLILSLLIFLIVSTSYLDVSSMEAEQVTAIKDNFAVFVVIVLALGVARAAQHILNWLVQLRQHTTTIHRDTLRLTLQFRDVLLSMLVLHDREFLQAIRGLSEMDQKRLEAVLDTIVPVFLKLQPGEHFWKQRIMPGVPFELWNKTETMMQALEATISNEVQHQSRVIAETRLLLLTLAEELRCHRSSADSAKKTGTASWHSRPLSALSLGRSTFQDGISLERFMYQFGSHSLLSDQELEKIFSFVDTNCEGTISMSDFTAALLAAAPPISREMRRDLSRMLSSSEQSALVRKLGVRLSHPEQLVKPERTHSAYYSDGCWYPSTTDEEERLGWQDKLPDEHPQASRFNSVGYTATVHVPEESIPEGSIPDGSIPEGSAPDSSVQAGGLQNDGENSVTSRHVVTW